LIALTVTGALLLTASVSFSASPRPSSSRHLTGTLVLTAGGAHRSGGKLVYSGTYFRMVIPGSLDEYLSNPSSKAPSKTYTFLSPGKARGLELGQYQRPPGKAFSGGNALASSIVRPQSFESIKFSISTAPKSAQGGEATPAPSLTLNGNKLTGNLSAWTAEWNRQYFNQGAPKPGGSYPGLTEPVIGRYNSKTHAFWITWYSEIVGGPFSGFTGFWHLAGHIDS
jgi:hypothetical protein